MLPVGDRGGSHTTDTVVALIKVIVNASGCDGAVGENGNLNNCGEHVANYSTCVNVHTVNWLAMYCKKTN